MQIDKNGWVVDMKVQKAQRAAIEHGALARVNAIVLHQTGAATAASTLEAWKTKSEGAHFLIAENGSIFQTASLKNQCWHVGKLYPRCQTVQSCSPEEAAEMQKILQTKNTSWGNKFSLITKNELRKDYPLRFPHNADSIGIEVVGVSLPETSMYELPNKGQLETVFWLLDALVANYSLNVQHIYAHGQIAHKDPNKSEGAAILTAYSVARKH